MLTEKDIELIEKHLAGSLTDREQQLLDERRGEDKSFAEEIRLREDLQKVSHQIARAEFKKTMMDLQDERSSNKTKKIYLYGVISLAIAASVLLFIFIWGPANERNQIKRFMAEAGPANNISVPYIQENGLKSDDSTQVIRTAEMDVAYILKEKEFEFFNHYFLSSGTLYLFMDKVDNIQLYYEIDKQGKRVYFVCRNSQLFKFRILEEGELLELKPVSSVDRVICK